MRETAGAGFIADMSRSRGMQFRREGPPLKSKRRRPLCASAAAHSHRMPSIWKQMCRVKQWLPAVGFEPTQA